MSDPVIIVPPANPPVIVTPPGGGGTASTNVVVGATSIGPQGPIGEPGVYISATAPTNTDVLWADTTDSPLSYTYNVVAKTSAYTILATDEIITCDTSSGAFNITLPAASTCKGHRFFFKKIDTSTNKVTIIGTIESDINPTLGPGIDDVTIFSNGSSFYYWGF